MNVYGRAAIFGLISILPQIGQAFTLLEEFPTPLVWFKMGGLALVTFGFAWFAYMRDPDQAWKIGMPETRNETMKKKYRDFSGR